MKLLPLKYISMNNDDIENVQVESVNYLDGDGNVINDDFDLDVAVEEYQISEAINEEMAIAGSSTSLDQGYGSQTLMKSGEVQSLLMDDVDSIEEETESEYESEQSEEPSPKKPRR